MHIWIDTVKSGYMATSHLFHFLLWLLFIDLFVFGCFTLSHEKCFFSCCKAQWSQRFNVQSRSGNWNCLMHFCILCVLQVCGRLSAGQAAVVSDSGPGQPHSAPRLPLLCGQSTSGTMPALLPVHEVSVHQTLKHKRAAGSITRSEVIIQEPSGFHKCPWV